MCDLTELGGDEAFWKDEQAGEAGKQEAEYEGKNGGEKERGTRDGSE